MTNNRTERTESEQIDFFARSHERFLRAREHAGGDSRFYRVADTTICLTFAGDALIPLITPALEHLRVPAAEPDLTLCVWDSRSTSVEMVPPPCTREEFTDHGEVLGFNSRRIRFAFHWSDYTVSLLDRGTRTGIYWIGNARAVPYWARAVPLGTLLHWWMQDNGAQILHGAAVGSGDGAVVIAGRSGRGKSTAALSCLQSGLYYLGDDYVVVRLEPHPRVYSLYCAAKLAAQDVAHFPSFADLVRDPEQAGREKHVMMLYPRFERQLVPGMRLNAILLPRVAAGGDTTVVPALNREVVSALKLSELQLPHLDHRAQDFVTRLCSAVPGYTLVMGANRQATPVAVADLLSRAQDGSAEHAGARDDGDDAPLLSVIVAVLNGQRQVKKAVERALSQDYPALEIVVVDAGSTDWTGEIVARLPYALRYFRMEGGTLALARNRGVREASGEFLAFLDLEDFWPDNTLGRLVDALVRDPETEVAYGSAQLVRQNPETDDYERIGRPSAAGDFRAAAAVFRKSAFARARLLDPSPAPDQDVDWFARPERSGMRARHVGAVTLLVGTDGPDGSGGVTAGNAGAFRRLKESLDRRRTRTDRVGADVDGGTR